MEKILIAFFQALIVVAPLTAGAVEINDDLTLNITPGIVSDYRSMGVSASLGNPAIQMDASLFHSSGAFVGLWGSSVDYGTKTRFKQGYYVGYYKQINEDIDVSASLARYEYLKEAAFDTNEFYGVVNFHKFRYGFIYDYDGKVAPNAAFHFVGYNVPLPYDANLYFQYGYNDLNLDYVSNDGSTRQTYRNWQVALSKKILGIDWSVSYEDTDIHDDECENFYGRDTVCAATVVFGAKKTF